MLALVSGCSYGSSSRSPTLTLDQASQRMTANVASVVAGMPVKPRLEPNGGLSSTPCDGGLAGSPTNIRVQPAEGYFLRDVPADRNPEIFASVKEFAAAHGFQPRSSDKSSAAYADHDGFGIQIQESVEGSRGLSLNVSAPSIWPDGTPPPK